MKNRSNYTLIVISYKILQRVAYHITIPQTKTIEIFTDVIDNDVKTLKVGTFVEKHSTLKCCVSVVCRLNMEKNWWHD